MGNSPPRAQNSNYTPSRPTTESQKIKMEEEASA